MHPLPSLSRAELCRPAAVAVRLPFWQRTRMLTLYDSDEFRMNFSEYLSKRTRPGVSGCAFEPDLISLFTQVPRIVILRSSPFGHSQKFAFTEF
jgi:hypothetical protein